MFYSNSKRLLICSVLILALALLTIYLNNKNSSFVGKSKEAFNITHVLKRFGYAIEEHEIVTEDGYILTLHRIPSKICTQSNPHGKIPILFVHGYLNSAIEFVISGPEKALSLILADKGFDVWFVNARGTSWSRKHKTLDPDKDKEYWDFSFHEIGYYDIPSSIDYVLNETGQVNLHYVGFSQGTQVFGVMGSERPEYAQKVKLATLLAPAFFIAEPSSPIIYLGISVLNILESLHNLLGHREIFSPSGLIAQYLRYICDEDSVLMDICIHHIFVLQGFDEDQLDRSLLAQLFMNVPSGSSQKQFIHIMQLFNSGLFQKFDYGPEINLEKYGIDKPSQYNYSQIKAPVALYYGENDWAINVINIEKIEAAFPKIVKSYKVPFKKFNHNDFLIAKDAVELVYNSVIEEILKY